MAITISNPTRNIAGNLRTYSGDFTTAKGDSTLTITHGMYNVVDANVNMMKGAVNTQNPKITHSAGVCTFVVDDTMANSGTFYFLGS